MLKRTFKFNFSDGSTKEVNIKKVTSLNIPLNKVCFHLDKIDDGYVLIVNENFWDTEKQKLINIELVREN